MKTIADIDTSTFPKTPEGRIGPWYGNTITGKLIDREINCFFCDKGIKARAFRYQFRDKEGTWRHGHKRCSPKEWQNETDCFHMTRERPKKLPKTWKTMDDNFNVLTVVQKEKETYYLDENNRIIRTEKN